MPRPAEFVGWAVVAALAWSMLTLRYPHRLGALGYALAAVAFLAASVIQLIRSRTSGHPALAWSGTALLTAGAATIVLGATEALPAASPSPWSLPLTRVLALTPALILLGVTVLPALPRLRRPGVRVIAVGLVAYAGIGLTVAAPGIRSVLLATGRSALWPAIGAAVTAGWALLAALVAALPRFARRAGWSAALALLAASSLSHTIGLRFAADRAESVSAGLLLAAAAVILAQTWAGLRSGLGAASRRLLQMDAELRRTRRAIAEARAREAERRHDARTAVLGIEAAVGEMADPGLAHLVTAELRRLAALLSDPGDPPGPFVLDEAVEPVIEMRRRAGLTVSVHPPVQPVAAVLAYGQPRALAGALAAVLDNAATHAAGSGVTVRWAQDGPVITIVVDDDGPGIPELDRERVLRRAERGSAAAPGSGLGLYTAARAMADQGGALRLAERPGGGTRVLLSLPAAAERAG